MMYLCFLVLLASVAKLGYAADLVHSKFFVFLIENNLHMLDQVTLHMY